MKHLVLSLAVLLCVFHTTGTAQTPVNIGGYIETYYSYDFSRPSSGDRSFAFNHSRHNEFAVNLALLDVRYNADDVRARLALQTGTYAISNYSTEPVLLQALHEASAGFRVADNVWIDAGILGSHIGAESAIGRDNATLTRSLAAEYSPYYETGVRLEFLPSPQWTIRALALNGWQNIRETNSGKAVGTQVQWKPSGGLLLNWSTFAGNETPDSAEGGTRVFNDFYVQFAPTEELVFLALFDIGIQHNRNTDKRDVWHTASLIAGYSISPVVSVAVRGEYFSDNNAVLFPVPRLVSGSLTIDWHPASNIVARIEGRLYHSQEEKFRIQSGMRSTSSVITTSLGYTL